MENWRDEKKIGGFKMRFENIEIYGEDDGYGIVHNHFEKCPCCKEKNAPTDIYADIEKDDEVCCENCGTTFKIIEGTWYGGENIIEVVK
jgi:hypothetical protein